MQAPLVAEGRKGGKQHQANQSINLAALPKAADRRQLTSIQLESDAARGKSQSGVAAKSCNSKTASDDHAAKRPCDDAVSCKLV